MTRRILIVDDSNIIRSHCALLLRKAGYEVAEAWGAEQAKAALNSSNIALMLCDLNLPGMNGLDLVKSIRTRPELAELPVVIFTAECSVEQLKLAKQLGIKHWLLKPYTAEELLDVVARHAAQAPLP